MARDKWGSFDEFATGYGDDGGLASSILTARKSQKASFINRQTIDYIFEKDLWGLSFGIEGKSDTEILKEKIYSIVTDKIDPQIKKLEEKFSGEELENEKRKLVSRNVSLIPVPTHQLSEVVEICKAIRGKVNFDNLADLGDIFERYYKGQALGWYSEEQDKYFKWTDIAGKGEQERAKYEEIPSVKDSNVQFGGRLFKNLLRITGFQSGIWGVFVFPYPARPNEVVGTQTVWNLKYNTGAYGYGPQYGLMYQFSQTDTYKKLLSDLESAREKAGTNVVQSEWENLYLQYRDERHLKDQQNTNTTIVAQKLSQGDSPDDITAEEARQAINWETQRLLAQNVVKIAEANRDVRGIIKAKKYKKTFMIDGEPHKLINLLTYRENSEDFAEITVPDMSSLVPIIRLYKVNYNDAGRYTGETEIVFDTYTNLQSNAQSLLGGGRSGVGIKSFQWDLNAQNPASIKSDITAKLSLYFQSFDNLLEERDGFKYLDLLVRSDPPRNSDKEISDRDSERIRNGTTRSSDPKFYEIKAEVGWALNPDYIGSRENTERLQKALKSQRQFFFLTLVEHEFDISQEGTFNLTIDYRARLEVMGTDIRADVIQTDEGKERLSTLSKELQDARESNKEKKVKELQEEIKAVKDAERYKSNTDILNRLIKRGKLYVGYYDKSLLEAVNYDFSKIDAEKIRVTDFQTGLPVEPTEEILQKASDLATHEANLDKLKSENNIVVEEDQCSGVIGSALTLAGAVQGASVSNTRNTLETGKVNSLAPNVGAGFIKYFEENYYDLGITDAVLDALEPDTSVEVESTCYNAGYYVAEGSRKVASNVLPESLTPAEIESGILESDGRNYIPYFFLGDLIDIAAEKALGENVATSSEEDQKGMFNNFRTNNVKIILGSIGIQSLSFQSAADGVDVINIGDIPVSLQYYRQFWAEKVTKEKKENYPLIQFVKDCLNNFVLDCIGYREFDGERSQALTIRHGTISLPAKLAGSTRLDPIEDRIKFRNADQGFVGHIDDTISGQKIDVANTLTYGSRLETNSLRYPRPLTYSTDSKNDVVDFFHYKVFYVQNVNTSNMRGNKKEDVQNGILHFGLGENKGLLKSANFKRTNIRGLRESRVIDTRTLNPLNHLADVYNIELTLFGNTIFWPGQYLFFNPLGLGSGLGSPVTVDSAARIMGLGGYHFANQVSSYIENGKFETTVQAYFQTSGGEGSELASSPPEGAETNTGQIIDTSTGQVPTGVNTNLDNIGKKE